MMSSSDAVPTDILAALRRASIARQVEWSDGSREPLPVLFKATELGGEAGEVLNVVKKLERERLGWTGSRASVEQLADELADLVICADLLAEPYGIDLGAAIARKFNATSEQRGLSTRMEGVPQSLVGDLPAGVRPEVAAFALLMERELRANDHKRGWKGDQAWALTDRVWQEAVELRDLVRDHQLGTTSATPLGRTVDEFTTRTVRDKVASEAADVANMAMMVADVCGCLDGVLPQIIAAGDGRGASTFRFRRFVNGVEMAQGVTIERADALNEAVSIATRICPPRHGTVLVLDELVINVRAESENAHG